MKNGFLFFLNMGNITTAARIIVLPAFIGGIYFPFHTILYNLSWIVFVASLILSFVPAPSDKVAERVIKEFYTNLNQRVLDFCKAKKAEPIFLKGYEKSGKMVLRRQLGKDVIYPHLAAISVCTVNNKTFLVIARKSLLSNELAKYQEVECTPNTRISVQTNAIDDDAVVELNFSVEGTENQIVMYVKPDYHYRDVLATLQDFIK